MLPPDPRSDFLSQLKEFSTQLNDSAVTIGELLNATQGRGYDALLILMAVPFLTPIPLPGFSIPFGVIFAAIGIRAILGKRPWLPQKILARRLPPRVIKRGLDAAVHAISHLEWILRPRLTFILDSAILRTIAGALIAVCGFYLVLPLPIPFSNSLPALTILILASSRFACDGLAFIAGCAMFLITTGYFLLLGFVGADRLIHLRHAITGF